VVAQELGVVVLEGHDDLIDEPAESGDDVGDVGPIHWILPCDTGD
jgi:hypothetical protein